MRYTLLPTDADGFPIDTGAILYTEAWLDVLAKPQAYRALQRPVDAAVKAVLLCLLDVWIAYVDRGDWYLGDPEEDRPALARKLRALLEAWTPPELPAEITEAARAVVDAEGAKKWRLENGRTWDDAVDDDPTRTVDSYLLWPEGLADVWPKRGATDEEKAARDAERRVQIREYNEKLQQQREAEDTEPESPMRSPPSPGAPRMSIDEWAAMPEDEPGELVEGCLVEEEVADYEHETVVSFANAALRNWGVPRGGFVAGSEAKFAIREGLGRKPDLSVFLPGGSIPPRRGPIRVPPDIVIEVVSPTSLDARRDRIEKRHDYAAFGVRWVWLIDPAGRSFEVFELGNNRRYTWVLGAGEGSVAIPGCVDLTLDLDALWAELDRLGPTASEE